MVAIGCEGSQEHHSSAIQLDNPAAYQRIVQQVWKSTKRSRSLLLISPWSCLVCSLGRVDDVDIRSGAPLAILLSQVAHVGVKLAHRSSPPQQQAGLLAVSSAWQGEEKSISV